MTRADMASREVTTREVTTDDATVQLLSRYGVIADMAQHSKADNVWFRNVHSCT